MKLTSLVGLILAGGAALVAYDAYSKRSSEPVIPPPAPVSVRAPATPTVEDRSWIKQRNPSSVVSSSPSAPSKCDGRTHCSQMRSCEEAKYFIQNCPNTSMDGDGDRIPCEEQWCGH